MVYHRGRLHIHFIFGELQAPAKINLFLVGKKVFIKSAQLVVKRRLYKHRRTGRPKTGLYTIILPVIGFNYIKDPPTRKRIAKYIEPAPTGPGVFKIPPVSITQYLRPAGG